VFATTHWSVVMAAGQGESGPAQRALETLCRSYWYPIYVYVRRKGYGPEDAQDLTQEFFAQIIRKRHLRLADREKGKFRNFLLATLDYFLAREWNRAHRQKRGGRVQFVSLDAEPPEDRYRFLPADHHTPEKEFLRQWALAVLEDTMVVLGNECEASGKGMLFRELRPFLSGERETEGYAGVARRLAMSEGAVRVAVHRLRQRFALLLRNEIAQTVSRPEDVDEETRHLVNALGP